MQIENAPILTIQHSETGDSPGAGTSVIASGVWQVHTLSRRGVLKGITRTLAALKHKDTLDWDLSGIERLDHIGAQMFWNAWGKKRPAKLTLDPRQEELFNRIEKASGLSLARHRTSPLHWIIVLGAGILNFYEHLKSFIGLIGLVVQDLGRFVRNPRTGPWREISANIYHSGFQALGITALVGFLIGVVLSYLSAQQLKMFGGDIYLVNILGMSVIRELGPLLAAILVAGRSGSSITAQLGVMRVTEELDAMLVMGVSHGYRLIMPKVIALVACHFGLRIKPNTESLGRGTTTSVVTAITVVIVADAVYAIIFSGVGF